MADTTNHLSTDMGLKANLEKRHIQSNEMRYRMPSLTNPTREYDSCYYEITIDESVLEKYIPKKLHLQFSNMQEMNVYLYGGKSRTEATESIITGNSQVTVGDTYSISADKGFLVVAYPNLGKDTEFGFNYWLEAELKPAEGSDQTDNGGDKENVD